MAFWRHLGRLRLPLLAAGTAAGAAAFGMPAPSRCSENTVSVATNKPTPASLPPSSSSPALALPTERYDVVVVGAGIVGLATAREIALRYPNKTVCVLEKEGEVAAHQTGHNSGVIHAGIYYKTGSTMAQCCVEGAARIYAYCEEKGLPYERCGKLIVAPSEADHPQVEHFYAIAKANGVQGLEIIDAQRLRELEPNVRGYSALYSPNTGVVDFALVARSFAKDLLATGRGNLKLRFEVQSFEPAAEGGIHVRGCEPGQHGPIQTVHAQHVITCAGLHADRLAASAGGARGPTVVPFRGTYYQLKPEYRNICRMNVYPTPKVGGFHLGLHFTPTVNERRGHGMIIGPGACIAFDREGYTFTDVNWRDLWTTVTNPNLWRFVFQNPTEVLAELHRDISQAAFIREAQRLIPSLTAEMTEPSFSGVMVQTFGDDGKASNDFRFEHNCLNGTTLHVRSAPSPACTASMAIADHIVAVAEKDFGWAAGQQPEGDH